MRMPVLAVPHGGGPCFFMDGKPPFDLRTWEPMAAFLRDTLHDGMPRPKALLVISAHWETARPSILAAADHHLYYDYHGFPPHTYELRYPAKGAPELAGRARLLLERADLPSDLNEERGLDHGVFIPLMLMAPEADIPVIQLSLRQDMDAAAHLAIGSALQPLRDEGVLILGTGMTYHDLRHLMQRGSADDEAEAFDLWLTEAATDPSARRRNEKLARWHEAPYAKACHPSPEHLLPLHVAAGAAGGDIGRRIFHDRIFGKAVSAYRFG